MNLKEKIGKRVELIVSVGDHTGTYSGPGSGPYYGIRYGMKDEEGNRLVWDTTHTGTQRLLDGGTYRIRATLKAYVSEPENRFFLSRVQVVETLQKGKFE